jgi:hypothetical protein
VASICALATAVSVGFALGSFNLEFETPAAHTSGAVADGATLAAPSHVAPVQVGAAVPGVEEEEDERSTENSLAAAWVRLPASLLAQAKASAPDERGAAWLRHTTRTSQGPPTLG